MKAKAKKKAAPGRLKRRSVIRIDTDQSVKAELIFVPGERPYIHFAVCGLENCYSYLSGFIADKDVTKLKRFVDGCSQFAASSEGSK